MMRMRILYMLLSGLAIGWLAGLSLSPVIREVIASLLAVFAGVGGYLYLATNSVKIPEQFAADETEQINSSIAGPESARRNFRIKEFSLLLPLAAILSVGVAIGATAGLWFRLAIVPSFMTADTVNSEEESKHTALTLGLVAGNSGSAKEACQILEPKVNDKDLKNAMTRSSLNSAKHAATTCEDLACLRGYVNDLCGGDNR